MQRDSKKIIRWCVQRNISPEEHVVEEMHTACAKNGCLFYPVTVVPLDESIEVPEDDGVINIYYGTINFIRRVMRKNPDAAGIFFNPQAFTMTKLLDEYKDNMLNSDGWTVRLGKVIESSLPGSSPLFIKPDNDYKLFSGMVKDTSKIKQMIESGEILIDDDSVYYEKMFLANPKEIEKEFRFVIVNGEVVGFSVYKINERLANSDGHVPSCALEFARDMSHIYSPADIFVMDICIHDNKYYIVSVGCFNYSGLYHCNIHSVVNAVNSWVTHKYFSDQFFDDMSYEEFKRAVCLYVNDCMQYLKEVRNFKKVDILEDPFPETNNAIDIIYGLKDLKDMCIEMAGGYPFDWKWIR